MAGIADVGCAAARTPAPKRSMPLDHADQRRRRLGPDGRSMLNHGVGATVLAQSCSSSPLIDDHEH